MTQNHCWIYVKYKNLVLLKYQQAHKYYIHFIMA
jgi:hypothetical protein